MTLIRRPDQHDPAPWIEVFPADTAVPCPPEAPSFRGVTGDSRAVQPGDLYCGIPGAKVHGAQFAAQAVAAGAVAVLTDSAGAQLAHDAEVSVPCAVVADPRQFAGVAASRVYGNPLEQLTSFGVTGTNGKTTTTYMMDAALRSLGMTTGMVGTVQTRVADQTETSIRTTPEAWDLHALFAVMVESGVTHVGLEVSSHALALHRVAAAKMSVAGFTNLSQDHLDFHDSMEEYFATKAQLFTPTYAADGVIWGTDQWATTLASKADVPVTRVGMADESAALEWTVTDLAADRVGSTFTLTHQAGEGTAHRVRCGLPGTFNVANAALAVVMMHRTGVPVAEASAGVATCTGVPGRMERVSADTEGPLALVDYAHTPDALAAACAAIRDVTPGKLVVVIGAGGDRDHGKREAMGAAVAKWADDVVVTDDNPRSEDPAGIRQQVLAGITTSGHRVRTHHVADRSTAIADAVKCLTGPGDTLLLAGKGHEQGQEVAGVKYPFDDRVHLAQALTESGFDVSEAYG